MTPGLDQAARLRARVGARRGRVVAVTSGKGGVGKTTLAANLGLELARQGRSTLLLDGDLGLANLAILFNVAPRWDLEDVVAGRCTLADAVHPLRAGLGLLSAAQGVAAMADLDADRRGTLLAEIGDEAAGRDYLLVDTGAGIGATVLSLLGLADRVLLVTTPEPTALSDAYALVKAARRSRPVEVDLVVNLAQTRAQGEETHAKLTSLTGRFLDYRPALVAVVPREECVVQAVLRQRPLAQIYPYARATRVLADLARRLDTTRGNTHVRTPGPLAIPVRR